MGWGQTQSVEKLSYILVRLGIYSGKDVCNLLPFFKRLTALVEGSAELKAFLSFGEQTCCGRDGSASYWSAAYLHSCEPAFIQVCCQKATWSCLPLSSLPWGDTPLHLCVEVKNNLGYHFSGPIHLAFWGRFSLAYSSLSRLGWLASESCRSCLPPFPQHWGDARLFCRFWGYLTQIFMPEW